MGPGQRDPGREAEHRFLKRAANRLALESALPSTVAAKVEASDPHERRRDNAEEIRRHLRDARARA